MSHASLCNAALEFWVTWPITPKPLPVNVALLTMYRLLKKKKKRLKTEMWSVWTKWNGVGSQLKNKQTKTELFFFSPLKKSINHIYIADKGLFIDIVSGQYVLPLWFNSMILLFVCLSCRVFLGKCRLLVVQCATSVFISANCPSTLTQIILPK